VIYEYITSHIHLFVKQKNVTLCDLCAYTHSSQAFLTMPPTVFGRTACYWQVTDLPGKRVVVLFGKMRGLPSEPAQSVALWLWEGTVSRGALGPLTT